MLAVINEKNYRILSIVPWIKGITHSFADKNQQTELQGNYGKSGDPEPWSMEIRFPLRQ